MIEEQTGVWNVYNYLIFFIFFILDANRVMNNQNMNNFFTEDSNRNLINKIDAPIQINTKNSFATFEANEKYLESNRLNDINNQIFDLERNIFDFNRSYKNLLIKLNVNKSYFLIFIIVNHK